jgi:hypothetical protein
LFLRGTQQRRGNSTAWRLVSRNRYGALAPC